MGRAGLLVATTALASCAAAVIIPACSATSSDLPQEDGSGGGIGGGSAGGSGGGELGGGGEGGVLDPGCEEQPCKLTLPQCGCPMGEQCTLDGDARTCIPEGTVGPGEPCGTCQPGHLCVNNFTGGTPVCRNFCDGDNQCLPPGGLCVIPVSGGATVCSQNCDPITDIGCLVSTMKCDIGRESSGRMRFFTHCIGAGGGDQGDGCQEGQHCGPGLGCFALQGETAEVCLTWCAVDDPQCPADTLCLGFSEPVLLGDLEYGACVPS